jgi:lycopene cyclase domain-containing protein
MTYTALAISAVLAVIVMDLLVVRTRLLHTTPFWISYVIIFGFQLVVNGVLTGYRIVIYDPQSILGSRLVHAPIEDLAFGFAMTLTTLMSWMRLQGAPEHAADELCDADVSDARTRR